MFDLAWVRPENATVLPNARPPRRGLTRLRKLACGPLLLLILCVLGGCQSEEAFAPRPLDQAIKHPSPGVRVAAVQRAIQSGDTSEVPELIEMLDDEDPTVRMLASSSLKRITGRDTGYLPYASPEVRRSQRDAWRLWWASQQQIGDSASSPPLYPVSKPMTMDSPHGEGMGE